MSQSLTQYVRGGLYSYRECAVQKKEKEKKGKKGIDQTTLEMLTFNNAPPKIRRDAYLKAQSLANKHISPRIPKAYLNIDIDISICNSQRGFKSLEFPCSQSRKLFPE